MSEQIRDITSEYLGPDSTDEECALTRCYLLAHGYEDSDDIGVVIENDWQNAVEWALRQTSGTPLPDDPTVDQVEFDARTR
jgi:hypothetical protein